MTSKIDCIWYLKEKGWVLNSIIENGIQYDLDEEEDGDGDGGNGDSGTILLKLKIDPNKKEPLPTNSLSNKAKKAIEIHGECPINFFFFYYNGHTIQYRNGRFLVDNQEMFNCLEEAINYCDQLDCCNQQYGPNM